MTAPRRRTAKRASVMVDDLDEEGLEQLRVEFLFMDGECHILGTGPCEAVREIASDACRVCSRYGNVPEFEL